MAMRIFLASMMSSSRSARAPPTAKPEQKTAATTALIGSLGFMDVFSLFNVEEHYSSLPTNCLSSAVCGS